MAALVIQHLIVRIGLWKTRCAPWHYPRFLDYAHERIVLHKVGGGYMFAHTFLLDYFASLDNVLTTTKQIDPV